jgi:hypothetical protein
MLENTVELEEVGVSLLSSQHSIYFYTWRALLSRDRSKIVQVAKTIRKSHETTANDIIHFVA